jgi:hypothetical protein
VWSRAELGQLSGGVSLNEERNEVPDWASVEAGVLFLHHSGDLCGLNLVICIGQSVGQLLDDLLLAQLDHHPTFTRLYTAVKYCPWHEIPCRPAEAEDEGVGTAIVVTLLVLLAVGIVADQLLRLRKWLKRPPNSRS